MKLTLRHVSAFSLVEVSMALGVAAFCLTSLFGLLPVGMTSNQSCTEQTTAANVATSIVADLQAAASTSALSPRFQFKLPSPSDSGQSTIQTTYLRQDGTPSDGKAVGDAPVRGESRQRVTVTFSNQADQKSVTSVRILITWPALADNNPLLQPTKFSGSYETVTLLDRN